MLYIFALLKCHADIELHSAPKKRVKNSLSIRHWNLNFLTAHDFPKLRQLKAYNSIYKHNFICLSETYLDSAAPASLLEIEGYNLVRADHLNNIKKSDIFSKLDV